MESPKISIYVKKNLLKKIKEDFFVKDNVNQL